VSNDNVTTSTNTQLDALIPPSKIANLTQGMFFGAQLSYVGYDLGSRSRRYDGRAFGIGVSYGYSWMFSKRWNVAVEAGIGLFHTKDTRRNPTVGEWDDEYVYHYRRWTLFPSKAAVSFSYLF